MILHEVRVPPSSPPLPREAQLNKHKGVNGGSPVAPKSREKAADVILAFTQGRVYTLLSARRLHGELLSQL